MERLSRIEDVFRAACGGGSEVLAPEGMDEIWLTDTVVKIARRLKMSRADRKSQVKQCLGFLYS